MTTIRARLAALLAGLLLARLAASGLVDASPELALALERWLERGLDLAVTLGYALLERWVRSRALPRPPPRRDATPPGTGAPPPRRGAAPPASPGSRRSPP